MLFMVEASDHRVLKESAKTIVPDMGKHGTPCLRLKNVTWVYSIALSHTVVLKRSFRITNKFPLFAIIRKVDQVTYVFFAIEALNLF